MERVQGRAATIVRELRYKRPLKEQGMVSGEGKIQGGNAERLANAGGAGGRKVTVVL